MTDVELRLLRVLDTLLETKSVTQAAARLGVTPSAVSHSLRELRRVMGDPLFVRSGSSLRPTAFATAVRPALRAALVSLRHVLHGVPGFDLSTSRRVFSIVMPDHLVASVLAPILGEMGQDAPNARVRLWPLGPETHHALASGELDLVLTAGHSERFLSLDRGMMRVRLRTSRFVCIVRKGHPVLGGGKWDLETYSSLPHVFVSLSGASRGVIDDAVEELGHARRIALTLAGDASVTTVVAATDLVATVPEEFARTHAKSERVAVLDPPFDLPPVEIYLWWHTRFQHDPAHIWWRTQITGRCAPGRTSGA
ncbi:MAG: LysR family transcriptional regulator [Caulobacteraceae bacterium]